MVTFLHYIFDNVIGNILKVVMQLYQHSLKNINNAIKIKATHHIHPPCRKVVLLLLCSCKHFTKMAENTSKSESVLSKIVNEIIGSPLNIAIVILIGVLIYKIVKSRNFVPSSQPEEPPLPKLKKRDFTVEELKKYDGTGEDGRVLVAVNGNVYDVTKGKRFYGPGECIIFIACHVDMLMSWLFTSQGDY